MMIVLVNEKNWKEIQIKLFSLGCKWINTGLQLHNEIPNKVKGIKINENNLMTTTPFLKY